MKRRLSFGIYKLLIVPAELWIHICGFICGYRVEIEDATKEQSDAV